MSLTELLSQLFVVVQFLAAFSAVYFWKYYKNTNLWIFMPFLVYSFMNDATVLILNFQFNIQLRLLYNIYTAVSFLVYLYWFDKLLNLKSLKYLVCLVFLSALVYDIFNFEMNQIYKASLFTVSLMILCFSVIYFTKLIKSDEVIIYGKKPEFWFILGLLLFYLAFTPLLAFIGLGYNIITAFYIAINILNYILYCCYITGLYVTRK